MGIPGYVDSPEPCERKLNSLRVLREIGKGERVSLTKLATDHFELHKRPLRLAIDAAIWNFQTQSGQGGKNPALRTLFFRLLRILALPVQPVFVYDGANKPLTKRGRTVSRYGSCIENESARQLLRHFRFPSHTAAGEAEAECAFLQKKGIVDAVMSQDVDAIMFGSSLTLRDWSKEGTKGNKAPTHVNVMHLAGIQKVSGLDPAGMVLVALLSGGDYDENGIPGFGCKLACEIARAGFGADLLDLVREGDDNGIGEWRQRLEYELHTNESGYFRMRHKSLKIPEHFPDMTVLSYYTNPAVSREDTLRKLEAKWAKEWKSEIDVLALRHYTAATFDWSWRSGARRFVRCFAQPVFQHRLLRPATGANDLKDEITEERKHFITDGIVELGVRAVPAEVVGIDIEAEEDNPEHGPDEAEAEADPEQLDEGIPVPISVSPSKPKRQPWSPYVPEKWWIPRTLLEHGLPAAVQAYDRRKHEIETDPLKFAVRKCPKNAKRMPRPVDSRMKPGAMANFLVQSTTTVDKASTDVNPATIDDQFATKQFPTTPTKKHARTKVGPQSSPVIMDYFRPGKGKGTARTLKQASSTDTGSGHMGHDQETVLSSQSTSTMSDTDSASHRTKRRSAAQPYRHDGLCDTQRQPRGKIPSDIATRPAALNQSLSDVICLSDEQDHSHERDAQTSQHLPPTTSSHVKEYRQLAKPLPIESFFDPPRSRKKVLVTETSVALPPSPPKADPLQLNREHVRPERSMVRVAAAPRDSLPGSWKLLEDGSARKSRAPRVSYVDLTGD